MESTTQTKPKPRTAIVRCKAFGLRLSAHEVMLDDDGRSILVWDDIAGHFTRHHGLSAYVERQMAKRIREAV